MPSPTIQAARSMGAWRLADDTSTSIVHGASANFKTCVAAHADFHRTAGAIARAINAKDYDGAERQLGLGTAFATATSAVAVAGLTTIGKSSP